MAAFVVEPNEEEKEFIETHTVHECCERWNTSQIEARRKREEKELTERMRLYPKLGDVFLH